MRQASCRKGFRLEIHCASATTTSFISESVTHCSCHSSGSSAYKLSEAEIMALYMVLLCLAQVGPSLSWSSGYIFVRVNGKIIEVTMVIFCMNNRILMGEKPFLWGDFYLQVKVSLSLLSWRRYCLCKSDRTYHIKWNTSLIVLNATCCCKGRNMIKLRNDRLNIVCWDGKKVFPF